jgi:hypothetical protein
MSRCPLNASLPSSCRRPSTSYPFHRPWLGLQCLLGHHIALRQVSSHSGGFACQQARLPPHPLPAKTGISDVVSLALPSFSPHATPKTISDITITTPASTGTASTTTNAPPPPHVAPVNFTNDYLPEAPSLPLLDTSRVVRSICLSIDSISHKIFSACQVRLA